MAEGGRHPLDRQPRHPKGARNVDSAYDFLDYLMEPEPAVRIVNGVHYAGANQAALPRIDAKIR